MNFDLLTTLLTKDEGVRLTVYDDATGQAIKPGSHVIGHPTIGIGRALDTHGLTQREAAELLHNDMWAVSGEIYKRLPWVEQLDEVRQVVLASMAFQMGVDGLLGFHDTLQAVQAKAYTRAAQEMLSSHWAQQTPARAKRLAEMMRTGEAG